MDTKAPALKIFDAVPAGGKKLLVRFVNPGQNIVSSYPANQEEEEEFHHIMPDVNSYRLKILNFSFLLIYFNNINGIINCHLVLEVAMLSMLQFT